MTLAPADHQHLLPQQQDSSPAAAAVELLRCQRCLPGYACQSDSVAVPGCDLSLPVQAIAGST